ncbi:MAG: aldolase/citrate lyase family protein [Alphaproteobacteria bacterium]|nr:aldolase/citrate lyase family protein [Alphaproteobacteria bacterium]
MAPQPLKAQCRSRDLKLGHFIVEFATPGIGHMLANAGCEFALFDCEHSGFGFETVKAAIRYFEAAGVPTIVRVPSKSYDHIARAADMGAEGVMLPMVNDAAEARAILDCLKYTPAGQRGVALGIAHDNYAAGDVLAKLEAANARTALIAQIETRAGVENADAIAAVDGVDCLWVGHFDLSASLGIPGQFDHPDFIAANEAVIAACRAHGKAAGRLVPDVDAGLACHRTGYDMICYSGDVFLFGAALKAGVDAIRAGAAG